MKLGTALDFVQNEARDMVFQNLSSSSSLSSPKSGQTYYDTTLLAQYVYNGSAFYPTDARLRTAIPYANLSVPVANVSFGGFVLNNVGTPLVATDGANKGYIDTKTLDTFASPVAALSLNSQKITNLATPTNPTDAANKSYVDSAVQSSSAGISAKGSCVAVATSNIATLSGTSTTIDGVTLAAGERVLLVGQTTASQNGPYVVSSGAWTRPTTDASNELETGALWFIEQGTTYAASQWWLNSPTAGNTITPGTTSIGIVQFNAAATYTASNGVTKTGNNFSAQVVAGGGVLTGSTGLYVDTSVVARKYSIAIGDGSTTTYTITHNLNTMNIIVQIRDSSGNYKLVDNQALTANTCSVTYSVAPTSAAQDTVTVLG
jgi:hypothetical protein